MLERLRLSDQERAETCLHANHIKSSHSELEAVESESSRRVHAHGILEVGMISFVCDKLSVSSLIYHDIEYMIFVR